MGAWVRPRWTLRSQLGNLLPAAILEWMQSLVDFCSSVVQVFPDREWAQRQRRGSGVQGGLRAKNGVKVPKTDRIEYMRHRLSEVLPQHDQKRAGRNTSSECLRAVSRDAQSGRLLGVCWKLRLPSSVCEVTLWTPCATRQCGFRVQENHRETLCVSCWAFLFLTAMSKVLSSAAMLEELRNEPVFKETPYSLLKRRSSVSYRRRWLPVTLNR